MKKRLLVTVVGCLLLGAGWWALSDEAAGAKEATMAKEHAAAMTQAVYTCPECHTVAMQAGKCPKCGMEMTASHVLAVKDGKAMLCGCGAGCKCDAAGMKDGKCACGKPVQEVSLKGMYVCPAGCPVISDKEGKCPGCGKEMTKVE